VSRGRESVSCLVRSTPFPLIVREKRKHSLLRRGEGGRGGGERGVALSFPYHKRGGEIVVSFSFKSGKGKPKGSRFPRRGKGGGSFHCPGAANCQNPRKKEREEACGRRVVLFCEEKEVSSICGKEGVGGKKDFLCFLWKPPTAKEGGERKKVLSSQKREGEDVQFLSRAARPEPRQRGGGGERRSICD